jgi:hypothetical protein
MALVVCGVCQRHVKRADSLCPFCGATMPREFRPALGGALVLGVGLAVVSCSSNPLYAAVALPAFTGGTAGSAGHAGTNGTATAGTPAAGNGGGGLSAGSGGR